MLLMMPKLYLLQAGLDLAMSLLKLLNQDYKSTIRRYFSATSKRSALEQKNIVTICKRFWLQIRTDNS